MLDSCQNDIGHAVSRLLASAPEMANSYAATMSEWVPEAPPPTIIFIGFAKCLTSLPVERLSEVNSAVWGTIEELIAEGSDMVRSVVATGLLESILADASAGRFAISSVAAYFGPKTLAYCKAWDSFTGFRTPGLCG